MVRASLLAWPLVMSLFSMRSPPASEAPSEPAVPPATAAIVWDVPAACPSREAFEAALADKLGRALWTVEDDVRLVVTVTETGPAEARSFEARIYWIVAHEPIDTRTIAGPDCATVTELAAEIAALAASPTLRAIDEQKRSAAAAPIVAPCPEPEPAPAPVPVPAPVPEPRARERLGIATAATGGIGLGETPQLSGVVRARLDLLVRRFRVGVLAHYRFERRAELPAGDAGVRVSAWAVGPRGCAVPKLGPIELPVCAEVVLGQLMGRPFGLVDERTSRSLWGTGGVGVGLWWPIRPPIAIGADAIGWVALRRPAFDTAEGDEIVRAAPAGFVFVLGVEGRFGSAMTKRNDATGSRRVRLAGRRAA